MNDIGGQSQDCKSITVQTNKIECSLQFECCQAPDLKIGQRQKGDRTDAQHRLSKSSFNSLAEIAGAVLSTWIIEPIGGRAAWLRSEPDCVVNGPVNPDQL
jgi:hypothetical protein